MDKFKSNPAKTLLTISVGFILIHIYTEVQWALIVAVTVGLIGIISNYLSKKIEYLWFKLAWVLSFIVPNIILTIVFYLFLFPLSLLSKLFGKGDSLNLKNTRTSLFDNVEKTFDKKSFENPW